MEQTSEMVQPEERMEDFGRLLEESLGGPEEGSVAKGRVVDLTNDYAVIDIGYKSEGLVPLSEFRREDGQISVQKGDEVEVLVERLEDADGMVVLSKDKADKIRIWDEISKAAERGDVVEGKIVARIKGGLSVDIGVRAFLPGSQVALRPVRQLEKLIGETYQFKIIKFNRRRGNIVLSRRVLLEEERAKLREKTLQVLEEGVVMKGVVKNITDYGAFVDLGGIDGLLHVTDMSWGRVNHPSEVVNIGDEVEVKILSFDRERERVSLGIKQLSPDPWESADDRYPIGSRIQGRVVSLADYGAFVELEPGIEGLVHVSEMSWTKRVNHPSEVVKVGDQVEVMVLNVDMNRRRISLGMKQCQPNPWDLLEERYPVGAVVRGRIRNITDFGIFVGVDEGIDGLIHVSDISWTKRVGHPATLYNVGEEVEAVVLHIDKDNERFSLGIKQLTPDPWAGITARYRVGSIVTGRVSNITDFGVFVELEPGVEGLVHVSEVSSEKVDDLKSMLEPGQEIQAEVLNIDQEERKISLSMKAIEDEKVRAEKMALDELNRQMAAHSATTLGEKILLAKQAKEAQENGEE